MQKKEGKERGRNNKGEEKDIKNNELKQGRGKKRSTQKKKME